jgi:hypothetical protein
MDRYLPTEQVDITITTSWTQVGQRPGLHEERGLQLSGGGKEDPCIDP